MDTDQFNQLLLALDAVRDAVDSWGVVLSACLGVAVGVLLGWFVVRDSVQ